MSVDLPSSSSLYRERRPRADRPRGRGRSLFRILALASVAILAAGGALLYARLSRPRIDRIDPPIGEPGQTIRIEGRNFGSERRDSRIDVDGVSPTASSYLEWSDTRLSLRLPMAVDSGLVRVVTRRGASNGKLFMNRARLPVRVEGERAGRSGPYISSISPDAGPVGSLLVISGLDFGANRGDAAVSFSWTAEQYGSSIGGQAAPSSVTNPESDLGYESWSDKEIRVRVPDGASSGALTIAREKTKSNAAFFRVAEAPGTKRYSDRRSYAISQTLSVSRIKASGPNDLYLWIPRPAETAYQRVGVLGQEPLPFVPEYRGTALFRFKDLATGSDLAVTQSHLVQVYAVETEIQAEKIALKPQDPPPLMAQYSGPDERIPSAAPEILALARRIAGGERNPWKAARLVWDWLVKNISWTGDHEHLRALEVLTDKTADSYSYAILACALLRAAGLPSLPVAGYLVSPNREAFRHYWVELYIYGFGWVPLDPVLGSGAAPRGQEAAWEDRQRYFGSMDNRHIAFSRGWIALAPMSPEGRRVSKDRRWSFQSFYEEATGGLDSYSSFWGDIEVTGTY